MSPVAHGFGQSSRSASVRSSISRAVLAPAPALVLAALGVQDPGNIGAIVRSADAAGATGVVLDEQAADPWGWKALRASMGSMFRLPVWREASAIERLRDWQRDGLRVVAADARDGVSMYDVGFTGPLVLVLGGEGAGLPLRCPGDGRCAGARADAAARGVAQRRGGRGVAALRGGASARLAASDGPVRRSRRAGRPADDPSPGADAAANARRGRGPG